jgi:hypothetical protein
MTIDVRIVPLLDRQIPWAEMKQMILRFAPEHIQQALFDLKLFAHQTRRLIGDAETVQLRGGYYFLSEVTNTLSLWVIYKDEADDDEDVIEAGGRISETERQVILEKWRSVPYSLLVSSGPGRSRSEASAIGYFCAGIASVFGGYIAAFEGHLSVGPGIYRPEEFARATLFTSSNEAPPQADEM